MYFKQLQVFKKVAQLRSFSSASNELYLSQSTISSHISNLEKSLNVKLFIRSKSKVELTIIGEILLQYVNQILSLINEAEETIVNYQNGLSGSLSIATSHTLCNWVLPDLLKIFKYKYPSIDIILHTSFTDQTIEQVINKDVQFGIIRTPSPIFNDPRLISKIVEIDDTILITSPSHVLNKIKDITLSRVCHEPFIVYGKGTSLWPQIKSVFVQAGLEPKISMELNDIHAVKLMVKLGMGIAFIPSISCKEELEQGILKSPKILDCPPIKRHSSLIYRKDQIITGPVEKFIRLFDEHEVINI